jgi:peptidyl-prolyl cis-trans isomerase D
VLKFIRRNAEAAWVKFMFLAIVVVFIFWGMGGIVRSEKPQIVARVNGDVIDPVEYQRAYNNLLSIYQDLYKDNFKPEMLKGLGLKDRAMDQLIDTTLLRQEAQRIGLRVGEIEVRDAIAALPAFQQDGHFNKDLYIRVLRANNLTPGEFEDSHRDVLLVRKLQDLILAGVHVSDTEVHDRYRFDNEKVNLRFVKLDGPAFLPEVQLSAEEVQAYFDKNRDAFTEPDRVRLEYVLYAPKKFIDKVEVSDAEVQRYYEAHTPDYEKPEQVHARHILFKIPPDATPDAKAQIRQRAEEVLAKVKAGEDFAALAQQYSEDSSAKQGGDLGFFGRGKMVKPFEDAAFAMAPGDTSDIVESPFGLHIIKVDAKEEARTQTLDEVRAQITNTLKGDKAGDLARAQAETDHAKAVVGETLAALAQADGLAVSTPPPFAQNEPIVGLGRAPDLAKDAFATGAGEVGPIVAVSQGPLLFRVTEKIAAHVPELSEIRGRVEEKLRGERATALAKSKAEGLLAELQKTDIDTAAGPEKLKVEETGLFTRQGTYVPKIGNAPELKKDAFRLTAEKPVAPQVYSVSGSSVVAVLKERVPADEEKFQSEKDNLTRQAEERRKGQALEEFLNYLKSRASIEVGQDFLASITDTGRPLDGGPRRTQ